MKDNIKTLTLQELLELMCPLMTIRITQGHFSTQCNVDNVNDTLLDSEVIGISVDEGCIEISIQ